MSRRAAAAVALAAAVATAGAARAEEGLFVARAVGGASTVHPDMPDPGGMLAGSIDLCVTERTGVVGSTEYVWHDRTSTLAFGAALEHLPYEGMWTRLAVYAGPAVLLRWEDGGDGAAVDLAGQAGARFEYLMMWGLGLSFELRGTLPAGLRGDDADRFDAASVALGAGLFTEF